MKAPESDAHTVLMPTPVRYIGQFSDSRGRRQNLSRHCARNIPYFHIDDRPYDNALTIWQPELGPIDDRRVFHTFIWQRHPTHHPFRPIYTQIPAASNTEFNQILYQTASVFVNEGYRRREGFELK